MDWAEKGSKKLEKVKEHSSSFSITDRLKIGYEKCNSYDLDASNSNLEEKGKPLHSMERRENKDQKTTVSTDASSSNLEERGKPLHSIDNGFHKTEISNKVRSA